MSRIKDNYLSTKTLNEIVDQPIDVKLQLLETYNELSSFLINDIMEEMVYQYCGDNYSNYRKNQYQRYGMNPGSIICQGNEKVKVNVPRIKDKKTGKIFNVPAYSQARERQKPDERLLEAIIKGLSSRDYQSVIEVIGESFGLSKSSVSNHFKQQSSQKLEEFHNRSLENYDLVAVLFDGKYLGNDQIIIALGITQFGEKIPLDFVQSTTENAEAIKGLLDNLIKRGLQFEEGLLACIDGSKGMRKAIDQVLGDRVFIQRCQWHKRENVVGYLNEKDQQYYKNRIQQAYSEPEYADAKQKLNNIIDELNTINKSAADSLREGLEETLTLHLLEIPLELRNTFSTTNCIENLNSQLEKYLGKVKKWHNSDQKHRWIATGLLEIENKMRKVNNYKRVKEIKKILKKKLENP